jgi:hypothetical protein
VAKKIATSKSRAASGSRSSFWKALAIWAAITDFWLALKS